MSSEIARREPDHHLENALAIRDEHTDGWIAVVQPIAELAAQVAATDFVPKALRDKPAAITAAILFGRELEMPPMHALSNIHMVEGKPTLAAETMRAMVFAAGHEIGYGEVSGSICQVKGRRAGASEWTIVTWTIADAQRAGVANKNVWKSYPRQMLTARATAELCRLLFPDVTHNIRATEELEDGGDELLGGSGGSAPAPETTRVGRAKAGTTKTRTTAPPPASTSGPLHGDPIPPPPPAVAPPIADPVAGRDYMSDSSPTPGDQARAAAEDKRQCPHISNGQQCRYYADHDGKHIYGGGLQDPVSLKHCGTPTEHESHAWQDGKVTFSCSGAELGGRTERQSEGDGSPDDVAATGTDDEYQRMLDEQANAEHKHCEMTSKHEAHTWQAFTDSGAPSYCDGSPIVAAGPAPDAPKPMIAAQTKALQARFKGLGWTDEPDDRESRLRVVSTILGRGEADQVETFRSGMRNEGGMSYDEAQEVLTRLAPCRSRDDVLELMVSITKRLAEDEEQAP